MRRKREKAKKNQRAVDNQRAVENANEMPKPPADVRNGPRQPSWTIYRSTLAERIGIVHAPNAETAVRKAIEIFGIKDPRHRLMARRIR